MEQKEKGKVKINAKRIIEFGKYYVKMSDKQ